MVKLGDNEFEVFKPKLKVWLTLEQIYSRLVEAVELRDIHKTSDLICLYVSTAFGVPVNDLDWQEVAIAFLDIRLACTPDEALPMFKFPKREQEELPWDYENRVWYEWAHMLAKEYGWTLEYIENMYVEDALGLLQEIMVDNQLTKEWQWALSENSIGFDKSANKSVFKPLERPNWMKEIPKEPKKIKIPKVLIPQGLVLRYEPD